MWSNDNTVLCNIAKEDAKQKKKALTLNRSEEDAGKGSINQPLNIIRSRPAIQDAERPGSPLTPDSVHPHAPTKAFRQLWRILYHYDYLKLQIQEWLSYYLNFQCAALNVSQCDTAHRKLRHMKVTDVLTATLKRKDPSLLICLPCAL